MKKKEKHIVTRATWETFWARKQDVRTVYATSDRIYNQILALGPVSGKCIVEVGAGTGRDSVRLHEQGANVIVLDYAQNSLRIIQNLMREKNIIIYPIRADAFHLPFRTGSVDIIFHQGLLEHFKTPMPLIQENYRVLKSGGHALIDVPQRYHLYTVIKHILIWLNAWFAGWETEFSVKELSQLMKKAGFGIHAVYGDWMRPSLFYRMTRELLLKVGIRMPLYPKSLPCLNKVRAALRKKLQKSPIAGYTYLDIGVVGIKEASSGR